MIYTKMKKAKNCTPGRGFDETIYKVRLYNVKNVVYIKKKDIK